MRVPDEVKNAVAFLGYRTVPGDPTTEKFGGTGFLVALDIDGMIFPYLVTADHVARNLENYEDPVARINDIYGNGYVTRVFRRGPFGPVDPWHRHEDKSADVAVQVFHPIPYGKEFDRSERPGLAYIPESMLIHESLFNERGVGIGDEVFVAGLFHFSRGSGSNSPIIRVGNLAMIPSERVRGGGAYGEMDAYLVETRSFGNLSGSPVFIRGTVNVERPSKYRNRRRSPTKYGKALSSRFFLIGLMHGHWDISSDSINEAIPRTDPYSSVNMGVAIVTPARKIREILYGKELSAERDDILASRKDGSMQNRLVQSE
jgi:hypothetical protein